MRLRLGPGKTLAVRYSVLHRLARSVRVLSDCYDLHIGAAMCAVCEKPIEEGDESVPYDHVCLSGGAGRAGHVPHRPSRRRTASLRRDGCDMGRPSTITVSAVGQPWLELAGVIDGVGFAGARRRRQDSKRRRAVSMSPR